MMKRNIFFISTGITKKRTTPASEAQCVMNQDSTPETNVELLILVPQRLADLVALMLCNLLAALLLN